MNRSEIIKYPRTPHVEGSSLQPGDFDLRQVPIHELRGKEVVIEEKVDGANAGISFDASGELRLQSRGHYLDGGGRERHFNLLKRWATAHQRSLRETLGARYLMFGEWLYAKHTIFYDALPHYFLAFDVFDKQTGTFLSTPVRQSLLERTPAVCSVRVIATGKVGALEELREHIGRSPFITPESASRLGEAARSMKLDPARLRDQTDLSGQMEGLYIKVEKDGVVNGRYKFIRPSFLTAVAESEDHWLNRPIIPNRLLPGVDLFHPNGR